MELADAFSPNNIFKWEPRTPPVIMPPSSPSSRDLTDIFQGYSIHYLMMVRTGELGSTGSTLVGMRDDELDDMMTTLSHLFRWDLIVDERYGIKAAVSAERRRLDDEGRRRHLLLPTDHPAAMDALSQEGNDEGKEPA